MKKFFFKKIQKLITFYFIGMQSCGENSRHVIRRQTGPTHYTQASIPFIIESLNRRQFQQQLQTFQQLFGDMFVQTENFYCTYFYFQ